MSKKIMSSFRLTEKTTGLLKKISAATGKDQTAILEEAVEFYGAEHSEPWSMTPERRASINEAVSDLLDLISGSPTYEQASRAADLIARQIDKP